MKRSRYLQIHSAELRSGTRILNKAMDAIAEPTNKYAIGGIAYVIHRIIKHWKTIKENI